MTGLRRLSIQPDIAISSVLSQMSCRLVELVCCIPPGDSYLISEFLSTQPTIEKLTINCSSDDISTLDPDALPALRELTAPSELLFVLLNSRLSRVSRLTVRGAATNIEKFIRLVALFEKAKPPNSLELITEMDLSTHMMTTQAVSLGLALVGHTAPFITSLGLVIYRGEIQQGELQNMFTFALPWFPNLKGLFVLSLPPNACNRNSRRQLIQTHSSTIDLLYGMLLFKSHVRVDMSVLFPQSEQTPDQPNSIPNALYDKSCHIEILKVWCRVHAGLEFVLFPENVYICTDKEHQWND